MQLDLCIFGVLPPSRRTTWTRSSTSSWTIFGTKSGSSWSSWEKSLSEMDPLTELRERKKKETERKRERERKKEKEREGERERESERERERERKNRERREREKDEDSIPCRTHIFLILSLSTAQCTLDRDRYTCRTPHFHMHSHCTWSTCAWLKMFEMCPTACPHDKIPYPSHVTSQRSSCVDILLFTSLFLDSQSKPFDLNHNSHQRAPAGRRAVWLHGGRHSSHELWAQFLCRGQPRAQGQERCDDHRRRLLGFWPLSADHSKREPLSGSKHCANVVSFWVIIQRLATGIARSSLPCKIILQRLATDARQRFRCKCWGIHVWEE